MKQIAVQDLREGQVFPHPLYMEKDKILVPAGQAIEQKDLDRLQGLGIKAVETEEDPGADAESPQKILSLADVKNSSVDYRNYVGLIIGLDRVFTAIAKKTPADIRLIEGITAQILKTVQQQRDGFINYILGGDVQGHALAKNSVNTAILSAHIAREMRLPNHRLMQTITGALLHDVGMLRLSPDLVNKTGDLSKEEAQRMKGHTLYSYKIVNEELSYPEEMGALVMQHHENWDGSGYPQGLAGTDIHFGARRA